LPQRFKGVTQLFERLYLLFLLGSSGSRQQVYLVAQRDELADQRVEIDQLGVLL
jgi:hypothetical protein